MDGTSDEITLIRAAQSGDMLSAEKVLDNYKPMVSAISRRYFIAGATHEDAVQEGMIGLFNAVMTYKEDSVKFSTYAYTCIKSRILDAVKSASRNKNKPLNEYVPIDTMFAVADTQDYVMGSIAGKELESGIKNELSDKEYSLLVKYLEGKSYAEIAQCCGISIKGVDNALQKIKRKIKTIV
ncbi:MAG: sigma-70 family RNA polymerase sigma factor [Clostridia bacterium]|nr:sigma-70 family RNA polymerase sigma factor [Clostridia bacterium]